MMEGNEYSLPLVYIFPLLCTNYLYKYYSELFPNKVFLKRKKNLLQKEEASFFRYEKYITHCCSPFNFNSF